MELEQSPRFFSSFTRRIFLGVAFLFGYPALPSSAQTTQTLTGPANVSYCDSITLTTRFVNTGAALENLSITQIPYCLKTKRHPKGESRMMFWQPPGGGGCQNIACFMMHHAPPPSRHDG